MRSSSDSRRAGFLLLEAVIALAIIGVVAVGVLASTAAQVRSADKAGVLLVARALAEDRATSFKLLGYDDLVDPPDSILAGVFPPPFDEFVWSASVAATAGEYDLFTVEVVTEGRGERFPMTTLLHRPRPQIAAGGGAGGGSAQGGNAQGGAQVGGGQGGTGRGGAVQGRGAGTGGGGGTGQGGGGQAGTGRGGGTQGRGGE